MSVPDRVGQMPPYQSVVIFVTQYVVNIAAPCCTFRCALETLDRLSESLDLTDFASRIIHPIIRTLDTCPELRSTAMDTLCSLVFQLGKQYSNFIPTVHKVRKLLSLIELML